MDPLLNLLLSAQVVDDLAEKLLKAASASQLLLTPELKTGGKEKTEPGKEPSPYNAKPCSFVGPEGALLGTVLRVRGQRHRR